MIGAISAAERGPLAEAASNTHFAVRWLARRSAAADVLLSARASTTEGEIYMLDAAGRQRPIVFVGPDTDTEAARLLRQQPGALPTSYIMAVKLADASWVVFDAPRRFWGLDQFERTGVVVALLAVIVVGISLVAALQLSRPIRHFAEGLRRFGKDPRSAPLAVAGPFEMQDAIRAFNAMQSQIQAFVSDRTAMLAAISHDLRTPLTRIRLRGELMEDANQRSRLFRDVADMQAMVDSALSFFRDDGREEEPTSFDLPELLKTIVDDFADQGHAVGYRGPDRLTFKGRPFALKRAFSNIIDNAIKYGGGGEIDLRRTEPAVEVIVRDEGPGIPPEAQSRVFEPFYRLERSRNRGTGGVGLGLTSTRSVIQAHGGSIELRNRETGGLEVSASLPR